MNLTKLKDEMKVVGLTTLYFLICFLLFLVIKKLLLLEYDITIYGLSSAIISALAMGKVVFFIDKLAIANRLKLIKPVFRVIFTALIYSLLVFAVMVIEKSIHYWLDGITDESLIAHIFHNAKWAKLLAHNIFICACFLVFFSYHYLRHALGHDKFYELLTKTEK